MAHQITLNEDIVNPRFLKSLACSLALFAVVAAYAQKPYSLKAFAVSVNGTSTLHEWTSEVTKCDWSGQLTVDGGKLKEVKNVTVSFPVESIKSTKGGTMDKKTYEAFQSDKNPNITYKLTSATITGNKITANGTLTMAGATKNVVLLLESTVAANGDVSIEGSHKLNMKDFKMIPPKAVMGTIKVGPEVTILIELTLSPQ